MNPAQWFPEQVPGAETAFSLKIKQKLHEEAIKFMKAHGFEDEEEKREHFLENINNILTIIEKNLPHQSISAQSFIAMGSKFSHAHQRK